YNLLKSAAISSQDINDTILRELLKEGLLQGSDEINKYTITAKGIWIVEKNENKVSEEKLIHFLNSKYFSQPLSTGRKPLSEREKVIIFSMIAGRAFSIESPVDLKKDEYAKNAWKRILDNCSSKLHQCGVIKKMDEKKLYGKEGNEHPVSNLIRHTDSLPKKTKGIYTAAGQQKYYLDIYLKDKNALSKDALVFLIRLIFGNSQNEVTNIQNYEEVYEFCRDMAYEEAKYLYDLDKLHFVSPTFDDTIKEAFRDAFFS
ncbi:MAG: hypothetical protein QW115_03915, partial [Thermoplasmata archaeon]